MCGVVGGFCNTGQLLTMLHNIQHRGFLSCGVATEHGSATADGSVANLVRKATLPALTRGTRGVGHVRYATEESSRPQPICSRGQALVYNGQVEGNLLAALRTDRLRTIKGAYSYLWMTGETIYAGRDPYGFRPLWWCPEARVAASEPIANMSLYWREVLPGSQVDLLTGTVTQIVPKRPPAPCRFEAVYFGHVTGYYDYRRCLGEILARREDTLADAIVPVPDSGIAAAERMAECLNVPLRFGIVRNRYAERTFINEWGQAEKYTLIPDALRGRLILVDDSIVRGNTLNYLVPRIKQYASEVHVRVTWPPITHPCPYGVHITEPGVTEINGADSVRFLVPSDFSGSCCRACVTGGYPDR